MSTEHEGAHTLDSQSGCARTEYPPIIRASYRAMTRLAKDRHSGALVASLALPAIPRVLEEGVLGHLNLLAPIVGVLEPVNRPEAGTPKAPQRR